MATRIHGMLLLALCMGQGAVAAYPTSPAALADFVAPAAAAPAAAAADPVATAPACRPARLRMTAAGDGDLNGMSHGGVLLVIRNLGPDCTLAAPVAVSLRSARGRVLPARARPLHPAAPDAQSAPSALRLARGAQASMTLRWIAAPVYPRNRSVRAARVRLAFGASALSAPLDAVLYGPAGQPVSFERGALRMLRVQPDAMRAPGAAQRMAE